MTRRPSADDPGTSADAFTTPASLASPADSGMEDVAEAGVGDNSRSDSAQRESRAPASIAPVPQELLLDLLQIADSGHVTQRSLGLTFLALGACNEREG